MYLVDRRRLNKLMATDHGTGPVSIRQLADAAGYKHHTHLAKLLRGDADTISRDAAQKIANFFEVELHLLFADERPPEGRRPR